MLKPGPAIKTNNMKRVIGILLCILLLAGCRSSYITSSWKNKSTATKSFTKILVLGIVRDSDRELQRNMEKHLAGDLAGLGYTAVTSIEEYGLKAFAGLTAKEMLAKLKSSHVNAVLTIVLLNKKMENQFISPRESSRPSGYFQNLFWEYFDNTSTRVFEPGYYIGNTEYFWESKLYGLDKPSLLYSAKTTSFNPASTEKLAHQYGRIIVRDMTRKKLFKKGYSPPKKGF